MTTNYYFFFQFRANFFGFNNLIYFILHHLSYPEKRNEIDIGP